MYLIDKMIEIDRVKHKILLAATCDAEKSYVEVKSRERMSTRTEALCCSSIFPAASPPVLRSSLPYSHHFLFNNSRY